MTSFACQELRNVATILSFMVLARYCSLNGRFYTEFYITSCNDLIENRQCDMVYLGYMSLGCIAHTVLVFSKCSTFL